MTDLKSLGEMISEALALQGMIDNAKAEMLLIDGKISANDEAIGRLESLKVTTEGLRDELNTKEKKVSELSVSLTGRMKKLEANNVSLPVGAQTNRKVNL